MSPFLLRHPAIDAQLLQVARTDTSYVAWVNRSIGGLDFQGEFFVDVHSPDDALPFEGLFHGRLAGNTPDKVIVKARSGKHRRSALKRNLYIGELESIESLARMD